MKHYRKITSAEEFERVNARGLHTGDMIRESDDEAWETIYSIDPGYQGSIELTMKSGAVWNLDPTDKVYVKASTYDSDWLGQYMTRVEDLRYGIMSLLEDYYTGPDTLISSDTKKHLLMVSEDLRQMLIDAEDIARKDWEEIGSATDIYTSTDILDEVLNQFDAITGYSINDVKAELSEDTLMFDPDIISETFDTLTKWLQDNTELSDNEIQEVLDTIEEELKR